jgi:hypothetical protein
MDQIEMTSQCDEGFDNLAKVFEIGGAILIIFLVVF